MLFVAYVIPAVLLAALAFVIYKFRNARRSDLQAREILASIGDAVIVVGGDGTVSFTNDAGRRLLDSGDSWFLRNLEPSKHVFHSKLNIWLEVAAYPDRNGGHTVLVRDITATRRMHDVLRESERALARDLEERKKAGQRIHVLAEASRILESSLDYETTFQELTRFLTERACDSCAAFVRDDEEIRCISHDERALLPEDGRFAGPLAAVFTSGVAQVTPDNETTTAFLPIPARSETSGVLVVEARLPRTWEPADTQLFEEIGRRAGLALEHARLYRSAQEINRLKDEFVAIVSHELRTPLTPILGAIYMLRTEPENPRILARAIDLIERNAKAQSKIVEDLLDVSRIISGKLRLHMESVDLGNVVLAAVETVRPAAEAKNIRLDVDINRIDAVLYGDADRLQQVAWNLLANSVKFTPGGGVISVELHQRATHAEFTVRDTGIGIGPDFLPHVFDRFRQADGSRTRAHGGLGLGLAIVRHLVESHGGTVQASSQGDRQGSTFTVKLPIRTIVHAASAG